MQILQQPLPSALVQATRMIVQLMYHASNLLQIGTTRCKKNTFFASSDRFSNAQLQLLKVKGMMWMVY